MNSAAQVKRCKKCGVHFIYTKNSKLPADIQYCHDCRGEKFTGTAVLLARVIEKMMRE
ncbi:MAG: hypothetical protein K0R80_1477 [Clostridia bacterium]|jgi:hypothetical protein|nr:hypothetical protein [Clostridia bacterium]